MPECHNPHCDKTFTPKRRDQIHHDVQCAIICYPCKVKAGRRHRRVPSNPDPGPLPQRFYQRRMLPNGTAQDQG